MYVFILKWTYTICYHSKAHLMTYAIWSPIQNTYETYNLTVIAP